MAWILDDGPFDILTRHVDGAAAADWPEETFYLAGATVEAARQSERRRRFLQTAGVAFTRFDIASDTRAFDIVYGHLRQPSVASVDLAEHEAIAWMLTVHQGAIFISADKGAAHLALAEVGVGRVGHPFDFWLYLVDEDLVTSEQFDDLCQDTLQADQRLPDLPLRCGRK